MFGADPNGKNRTMDRVVSDMSSEGARLRMPAESDNDRFFLNR